MRKMLTFLVLACLVNLPALSEAAEIFGQSRTYFQAREGPDSEKLYPLYEYLELSAGEVLGKDLSFAAAGWVRYDLGDKSFDDKRFNGDLQYAHLTFRKRTGNTQFDIGRVYVIEGVALEQIDGAYARTDLKGGFTISAYGGIPVETDFDERGGDYIYGGRIGHAYKGIYRVGLSYLKEENDGAAFREETGIDLWVAPHGKVQILGKSSYNIESSGWMEHSYSLFLGPFSKFNIRGEFSYFDYENYFSSATSSAFTFPSISPDEKVLTLGGEVSYSFTDKLSGSALYRHYDYDLGGNADYYGARLAYSDPVSWGFGISGYRMSGDTDRLRYTEVRGYGYKRFGKADITLDLLYVRYDEPISNRDYAYVAALAGDYDLTRNARVAADVAYGRNPDFDEEVRGFLKLVYSFGKVPAILGGTR